MARSLLRPLCSYFPVQAMPLPKGIQRRGEKFRGRWAGKDGPWRASLPEAQHDRARLQRDQHIPPPERRFPCYVERVRPFAGSPGGCRAQRRLNNQLVKGPTRSSLDQAVSDATQFATATNAAELLTVKQNLVQ